jgi:hypothetical protein
LSDPGHHAAEVHGRRGQRNAKSIEQNQLGFVNHVARNIGDAQMLDESSYGVRDWLQIGAP